LEGVGGGNKKYKALDAPIVIIRKRVRKKGKLIIKKGSLLSGKSERVMEIFDNKW
jgi:hypothetical protein